MFFLLLFLFYWYWIRPFWEASLQFASLKCINRFWTQARIKQTDSEKFWAILISIGNIHEYHNRPEDKWTSHHRPYQTYFPSQYDKFDLNTNIWWPRFSCYFLWIYLICTGSNTISSAIWCKKARVNFSKMTKLYEPLGRVQFAVI